MINVAIVGVGNCAKSLVEGVAFYKDKAESETKGLMFYDIGGYKTRDITFVSAWDIDYRKVGLHLKQAIKQKPNNAFEIYDDVSSVCSENCIVQSAPLLDGFSDHMKDYPEDRTFIVKTDLPSKEEALKTIVQNLKQNKVDVLLNYLPVGSQLATEFFMECALEAGVSVVNCIPVFIASDPVWEKKFIDKGIPIIGDDMRSQLGASIISAVLQELFLNRGLEVEMHYQDNIGGNTDFLNMLNKDRLVSKKISKENVIKKQNELKGLETKPNTVAAGPANYFPSLGDNKRAHWLIKAKGFGGAPVEFTADLSVQDSPNSAGVVIDAIRYCKTAKDLGIVGALRGPSAWTQKTPPEDMAPNEAYEECKALANKQLTNKTKSQVVDGN